MWHWYFEIYGECTIFSHKYISAHENKILYIGYKNNVIKKRIKKSLYVYVRIIVQLK